MHRSKVIQRVEDPEDDFKVSLYDCCYSGPWPCLYAILLPPCAAASALNIIDGSNWYFNCLCVNTPAGYRSVVREAYHIRGNGCSDLAISTFCAPCSFVQNLNEATLRGRAQSAKRSQVVQPWLSDPFDNIGNLFNCLIGWVCMPCAFAVARSRFDGTEIAFNVFCLSSCLMRSIIRQGYNLPGNCCEDIWFTTFCPCCAATQLLNEVDKRGNIDTYTIKSPFLSDSMERL